VQHVLGCEGEAWCTPATRALEKLLQPGSDAHLFTSLQLVRGYDDDLAAFERASGLVADYPYSGDALQLFAEVAASVGRTGDAEAAYGRLANSLPVGSSQWRQARLNQIDLRVRAGATADLCGFRTVAYGDAALIAAIDRRLTELRIMCGDENLG